MSAMKRAGGARAALMGAILCGFLSFGVSTQTAFAAKLGPYFPIPNSLGFSGSPKDALLKIQSSWLQNGLDNLKKARAQAGGEVEKGKAGGATPEQIAALEEKIKTLDADIEATTKELEIANDTTDSKEVQFERKRLFLLALNQWIIELDHLATEQMKIAILKDGAEALVAQNRNFQYSQQADDLEKAKQDSTITNWGASR
jgi:hypothetical protein